IYDSTDTTVVGSDQGFCIRITKFKENQKGSWECEWTTFLNNGADSITIELPFYDTGLGVGAITGGTGAYLGASGSFDLSCGRTEGTLQFTLSYRIGRREAVGGCCEPVRCRHGQSPLSLPQHADEGPLEHPVLLGSQIG